MSDRELLELAAKAAGMDVSWDHYDPDYCAGAEGMFLNGQRSPDNSKYWNPLTNDGDALRLAVRLQFHVGINPGNKVFCTPTYSDKPTVFESCVRHGVRDPLAATRRAIVRAAAEIGRSKE